MVFTRTSVEKQYEQAASDELRILVIGAGMAGLTATQLLRRDDRHPVLIERSADDAHPGYMLALMPMADAALNDLGVRESYRAASVPLGRYGLRSHTGRMMRVDPMETILARYGDYRGIARGALIDVLTGDGCDVAFGSTVTALTEHADAAQVTVTTAGAARQFEFDLVIIADGIGSTTRDLVLRGRRVDVLDTKWGGWVVWAPAAQTQTPTWAKSFGAPAFSSERIRCSGRSACSSAATARIWPSGP
jgi:salicylate hydroxylase